jgi:hypothetical protein
MTESYDLNHIMPVSHADRYGDARVRGGGARRRLVQKNIQFRAEQRDVCRTSGDFCARPSCTSKFCAMREQHAPPAAAMQPARGIQVAEIDSIAD